MATSARPKRLKKIQPVQARPQHLSMWSLVHPTIRPVKLPARPHKRTVTGPVLKVTYLYSDASNYKFRGHFHIVGELSLEELQPYLFDGEFFIPERIGLPSLVPEIKNDDDHLLHRFVQIEEAASAEYVYAAEELLERVRLANAEDWFAGIS